MVSLRFEHENKNEQKGKVKGVVMMIIKFIIKPMHCFINIDFHKVKFENQQKHENKISITELNKLDPTYHSLNKDD